MSDEQHQCARSKFVRNLRFLRHIEAYFVPSIGGIVTRSVGATREFRLPPGSISIGTYIFPFNADDFMGDLDDVLAKLDADRRTAAA